jgi:hypothetical protein
MDGESYRAGIHLRVPMHSQDPGIHDTRIGTGLPGCERRTMGLWEPVAGGLYMGALPGVSLSHLGLGYP